MGCKRGRADISAQSVGWICFVFSANVTTVNDLYRGRYCFTVGTIATSTKLNATPSGGPMPELGEVDMDLVSDLLKNKRGAMSLRKAAAEIGVSAPTLQRIEAKQVPTTSSLVRVAEWLGVSVDDLRRSRREERSRSTVEQIEVYLRADPNLDKDAATTIASVVKQVYDGFRKKKKSEG